MCVLLPAQVQHPSLPKTGLARSGGLRKEATHQNLSLFSPRHWLKSKDTGLPSFTDVVETMGDFSLGQLRSPSAYSLLVQAALRNAFVLGLQGAALIIPVPLKSSLCATGSVVMIFHLRGLHHISLGAINPPERAN